MEFKAKIDGENHFEPISSDDFKMSLKLKTDDIVNIETWKERNIDFHRKYFALLKMTLHFLPEDEKYDRFRNIDYLRKELMIMIGEVDVHVKMDGEQVLIPKSISFKSMDNEKFQRIYNLSTDACMKYFLQHLTYDQFLKYVIEFY